MPPGLPGLPKIKLPENPLSPLRKVLHEGHQQIEKAGRDIRSIAEEFHSGTPSITSTTQDTEKAPEIEPQSRTASPTTGASKLTSEETIAYQKREIAKELWQLEKHLAQGCRIPDKTGKRIPCDCCEKGSWIAGLAYESIPIAERAGQTSDIFEKIAQWSDDLAPMVTVAAVESGQYDYKKLSGEVSALRKELMGTLALGSLLSPSEHGQIANMATRMMKEEGASLPSKVEMDELDKLLEKASGILMRWRFKMTPAEATEFPTAFKSIDRAERAMSEIADSLVAISTQLGFGILREE